jgi:hypothetical protein
VKQPELVYWKGSGEVRPDLLQAIKIVGYRLTTVGDIDEVLARPVADYPGIVLVDASGGEAEASQRVIEISAANKITEVPIIFLSYQATRRSAVLKKTFTKFLAVDIPFKLQDLLQKFMEFCPVEAPAVASLEATNSVIAATALQTASGGNSAELTKSELQEVAPTRAPISQRDPASLKSSCGGEFFAAAERLDLVDDKLLIPAHPNYEQLVLTLNKMTTVSSSIGLHARRVAFLAAAISRELGMNGDDERSVRIAGLFLNWGIHAKHPRLVNYDMLLSQDADTHRILGSAFAESANYVRDSIKDEQAAKTIENISKIILTPAESQNEDMLGAHCALVPELTERSAWVGIKWDSNGAHRTIRKLLAGTPYTVPSPVITEISRALSEASSVRARINPLRAKPAAEDDYDLQKITAAKNEASEIFQNSEKSSQLVIDLKAGMKLAEPIVSLGGKLLLKANINLTDELIHDLWRTSVINPVKPETFVLAA